MGRWGRAQRNATSTTTRGRTRDGQRLTGARRDAALFGSRRPEIGAGLRQPARAELADGLDPGAPERASAA